MEFLQSHEAALCTLLSRDLKKLLDHIEDIVTLKQYRTVNEKGGKEAVQLLLEIMVQKTEDECQQFVEILRKNYPEVEKLSTIEPTGPQVYADQGSTIVAMETANTTMKSYTVEVTVDRNQGDSHGPSQVCHQPVGSHMVATNNSYIFAPKLKDSKVNQDVCFSFNFNMGPKNGGNPSQNSGANTGKRPHTTISDKLGFFKDHYSDLTQKVKNVQPILDTLIRKDLHKEMAANIRAEKTTQMQMRKILEATTTKTAAEVLFQALLTHEGGLMNELMEL